jgi:hypothetical protein
MSIMKRKGKLLLGTFIILVAALFIFAPTIPQTALGPSNRPSTYPYCGTLTQASHNFFASPLYAVFNRGFVYFPQEGSLGWAFSVAGAPTVFC